MSDCFQRALVAREHRCLGFRLRPLAIGHLFTLYEIGSPFVAQEETPVTAQDVAAAVYICTHRPGAGSRSLDGWSARCAAWLLGWMCSRRNLQAECDALSEYLREGCESPAVKCDPRIAGARCGTPLPWQLLAMLWSTFGSLDLRGAMDMRVSWANALLAAHAEATGRVELWGPDDQSFVDWCAEQDRIAAAN